MNRNFIFGLSLLGVFSCHAVPVSKTRDVVLVSAGIPGDEWGHCALTAYAMVEYGKAPAEQVTNFINSECPRSLDKHLPEPA